jgi:hypothetical protein
VEDRERAQSALRQLVGLPLVASGLAASMPTWQFGELRSLAGRTGKRIVGDFALHVQCPWRLVAGGAVVVRTECLVFNGELGTDETNAIIRFRQCLDPWLESVPKRWRAVEGVTVDEFGGCRIMMAEGAVLEAFATARTSVATEEWRLFRPGQDDRHVVMLSGGRLGD